MTATQAWNLLFEADGGVSLTPVDEVVGPIPTDAPAGWAGQAGPGIDWAHWPRSEDTRLPMMHVLTLRLPQEYRRHGDDFVGIAFFAGQGEGADPHSAPTADAESDDPFLRDLAAVTDHPQVQRRRDAINREFALMWLTEAEIVAGPKAPAPDLRIDGAHRDRSAGHCAWDSDQPTSRIWLVLRDDPNVGLTPRGDDDSEESSADGWQSLPNEDYEWTGWAAPLVGYSHLGGTPFFLQDCPEGLTPYFLGLEEIGDLDLGSGTAQIDLESDTFDWSR